jgi:hypothetical protein
MHFLFAAPALGALLAFGPVRAAGPQQAVRFAQLSRDVTNAVRAQRGHKPARAPLYSMEKKK